MNGEPYPDDEGKKLFEMLKSREPTQQTRCSRRLIPSFARIIIPIVVVVSLSAALIIVPTTVAVSSVSISVAIAATISRSYRFTIAARNTT